jgi:hypothetical protein
MPNEGLGIDPVADDPALARNFPVLIGAFADIEHDRLGVQMDRQFNAIHWRNLLSQWDYKRLPAAIEQSPQLQTTTAGELAMVMKENEDLYVMIGMGKYDLLFPAAVAVYVAEHTPFAHDRIAVKSYDCGHELYAGALAPLAQDIRDLINKASR